MISEPELEGGPEFPGRPGGPESPGIPGGPVDPAGAVQLTGGGDPRGRRPWRWALGGALAATAVWAGAWWLLAPRQPEPPPLRYALPPSLCDHAKLPALGRIAEVPDWNHTPRTWEHPGVDRAVCLLRKPEPGAERPRQWLMYEADVSVALHKSTDPGPEFGSDPRVPNWVDSGMVKSESVPGLGDRALVTDSDFEVGPRLMVLDGGAVFTLAVDITRISDGTGPGTLAKPDTDEVKAAMIEDMRELMAALRR